MPSAWVSLRSRRVSSAATTSAVSSSAASRGGASATSPMGVPASTSVPVVPVTSPILPARAAPLAQMRSLRWRGDEYCARGPAGQRRRGSRLRPAAFLAAAAAPLRPFPTAGDGAARAPGPALHPPRRPVLERARGAPDARRAPGALVRLGRSAAGGAGGRSAPVLEPRQPEGGDIRRDVLRQGRLGPGQPGVRGLLAQGRRQADPEGPVLRGHPGGPGLRRPSAGRQVDHRLRGAALRLHPLRLALHGGAARHPLGADAVPHRTAGSSARRSWAAWRAPCWPSTDCTS